MKIDSFNAKDQRRGIKKRRVEVCIFLLWLNFVFVIGCAGDVFRRRWRRKIGSIDAQIKKGTR